MLRTLIGAFYLLSVQASPDVPEIYSRLPRNSYLTLQTSGRTFKYLSTAPVFGRGEKRLGLGLSYVNETIDLKRLEASAAELFEYVRPLAEAQNELGVVISAYLSFDPERREKRPMWNIVYKRDESGGWKRVSHQGKTLPKDILGDSSWHSDLPRDLAAEKTALLDAEAWLALVDAGEYAKAWDVASSAWKGQVTKQHWQEVARTQMGTLGKLVSRAKVATLSTPITQGPSDGSYVLFEYRSKFSNKAEVVERLTEIVCDDGKWRHAGYQNSAILMLDLPE